MTDETAAPLDADVVQSGQDDSAVSETVPDIGTALERLMVRFGSLARRAAQARGVPAHDVDEVLQDVRIRLWKAQPSTENLERVSASYLVRVVSSAVVDRVRRVRNDQMSLDEFSQAAHVPEALQVAPSDDLARDQLATRLERAFGMLSASRRLAVQLHLEGYGRHEIGSMTGWTEPKVRNLLYRGLEDLRVALRETGGAGDA